MILAPECIDYAVRAYVAYRNGDERGAEHANGEMLPATVFGMQGLENLICYGKRLFGRRAGIEIHDRTPALRPSAVGVRVTDRFAERLGKY
ncbi:hypothetical protein [Devosia sp.]|jgi:hypothetical protein|uniref:hypothetical protein n=1 Tax=Devosia sp. TaxID=1871048 RepID=UPI0037BEB497